MSINERASPRFSLETRSSTEVSDIAVLGLAAPSVAVANNNRPSTEVALKYIGSQILVEHGDHWHRQRPYLSVIVQGGENYELSPDVVLQRGDELDI